MKSKDKVNSTTLWLLLHVALLFLSVPLWSSAQIVGNPANNPPAKPASPGQTATQQLPNTIAAPPLTVADKFDYRVVQTFGLRGFLGATVASAIGQAHDSPQEWGQDVPGYAQRYATAFTENLSRQVFAFGIESALHEDPRYFPLEGGHAFKERTLNALKQVIWTRTDNGGSSFSYGRMASAFGAGQLPNLWLPRSDNSFGDGMVRFALTLSADAGYNFLQEFIPFTRPRSLRHRH